MVRWLARISGQAISPGGSVEVLASNRQGGYGGPLWVGLSFAGGRVALEMVQGDLRLRVYETPAGMGFGSVSGWIPVGAERLELKNLEASVDVQVSVWVAVVDEEESSPVVLG